MRFGTVRLMLKRLMPAKDPDYVFLFSRQQIFHSLFNSRIVRARSHIQLLFNPAHVIS